MSGFLFDTRKRCHECGEVVPDHEGYYEATWTRRYWHYKCLEDKAIDDER